MLRKCDEGSAKVIPRAESFWCSGVVGRERKEPRAEREWPVLIVSSSHDYSRNTALASHKCLQSGVFKAIHGEGMKIRFSTLKHTKALPSTWRPVKQVSR